MYILSHVHAYTRRKIHVCVQWQHPNVLNRERTSDTAIVPCEQWLLLHVLFIEYIKNRIKHWVRDAFTIFYALHAKIGNDNIHTHIRTHTHTHLLLIGGKCVWWWLHIFMIHHRRSHGRNEEKKKRRWMTNDNRVKWRAIDRTYIQNGCDKFDQMIEWTSEKDRAYCSDAEKRKKEIKFSDETNNKALSACRCGWQWKWIQKIQFQSTQTLKIYVEIHLLSRERKKYIKELHAILCHFIKCS